MVQLNLALKEINCKIVYFGCGLGGKTTNLEVVHEKADEKSRGELTSIATESDRTLFFDFMPLDLGEVSGMRVRFQLYTVPGQVYYNSTRKLVLRGADGVIFIADSQRSKADENVESLANLEECLKEQGRSLEEMPHVIQFNKRDLEDIMSVEEMEASLNRYGAPTNEGCAASGEGVLETLKTLAGIMLERVKKMSMDSASKPSSQTSNRAKSVTTGEQRPMTDAERLQGGLAPTRTPAEPLRQPQRVESTPLDRAAEPAAPMAPAASAAPPPPEPPPVARQAPPVATVTPPTAAPIAEPVKPSVRAAPPPAATPIAPIGVQATPRGSVTTASSLASASNTMMISTSGRRGRSSSSNGVLAVVILGVLAAAAAAGWFMFLR